MAKAKVCAMVLLCAAGLLLTTSCKSSSGWLRIDCMESGVYTVDVAVWEKYTVEQEEIWYYTANDARESLQVSYAPTADYATYPQTGRAAQLTSYEVKWDTKDSIPSVRGYLDVYVPGDPSGKETREFGVLLVPATYKLETPVLSALRGDAESDPNTLIGQRLAHAKVTIKGRDVSTGDELTAEVNLTVLFGDYINPNRCH